MGTGDHKTFFNFYPNHYHHQEEIITMKKTVFSRLKEEMSHKKEIPKGCVAIKVGHEEEEQQRFVIPLIYMNHPLFIQLLKEAEEEYGFVYPEGPINIHCHVDQFRNVQALINQENESYHHHHHHHHHHHVWCF